jgi:hypothetical protein
MKRNGIVLAASVAFSLVLIAGAGIAQGRGMGRGRGAGMGAGRGAGMRCAQGQAGVGGGWWTRVTPTTAEQKSFVKQVTKLHADIRVANVSIANLRAQKAAADKIAAKQSEVTALRTKLGKLTTDNAGLLKEMGVPANCGICDGTGPKADCPYACPGRGRGGNCPYGGTGAGRGNGQGLRDGSGPNPNCPLKNQ